MNAPSLTDRYVKVRAYMTDDTFGYDHWRAAQFCAPAEGQYAVLVICQSQAERDAILQTYTSGLIRPGPAIL